MILILEISGFKVSFVESTVNAKGSKPEYFSQFLSCISNVSVATSPNLNGDFETSAIVKSFCVRKCSAISLRSSSLRVRFLLIDPCGTTTGSVGVVCGTTTGFVGVVGGVTTGIVGVVDVIGTIVPVLTTVGLSTIGVVVFLLL